MASYGKTLTLMLVALFLTLALLITPMTYAQTTSSYVSSTGRMGASYSLTMYSPNNQTVYNNTMLLNFNLQWTYDLIPVGDFQLVGDYAYRIDDNPLVSIESNQSASDHFAGGSSFKVNPSFSCLVNISNLTNGYHRISISALMYFGGNLLLNESSSPFLFLVQHPPNITIFSPQNQSYAVANVSLSSIPLNFTVDKPTSWIGYSLDNQNNMTVAGNSTLTGLTYGLHTLLVYANDTFGNTGNQTVNFTVEKPQNETFASTMTVAIVVVPIAIVCIAVVSLFIYHKKSKKTLTNY